MSETERSSRTIAQRIGAHVAPQGYYQATEAMGFLGQLVCHSGDLVAGSWTELVLDYQVGASGIADSGWIKLAFKFYSDWALFQTDDPAGANYVSAEAQAGPLVPGQSPATLQALKVRFDQKGHERPYQKAVIIDMVDGYLNPGDHILIRLGDRRFGGPGTRVQTFAEIGFTFRGYIDPLGTSRFAAIPGDVRFDIVAGAPFALQLASPRLVRRGEPAPLRLAVLDAWGNCCRGWPGTVTLTLRRDGVGFDRRIVALPEDGWAATEFLGLPTDSVGEIEIEARLDLRDEVPPGRAFVTIDAGLMVPRAFYADLHVHSDDTVGTNDTLYNLSYGRDVAGLDVLGYTANDFNVTKPRWDKAVELINQFNRPGHFVCYPGIEWCGNSCAGGDHNVVFLHDRTPEFPFDSQGRSTRSFEWNEDMTSRAVQPGVWPLEELWAAFEHDPEGHLFIPHVGGRRANLDWHYPKLERLIEIGSSWGHFHWFYQDALSRGHLLGASAAGDEHRGRGGGGAPGAAVFGTRGGLTGVLANGLDRATIGAALRARHTWATTGERLVGMIRSGDHVQGDAFAQDGAATIAYRFLGDAGWDSIAAYDQSGLIWERNLQQEAGYSPRRFRLSWGGARIRDRYRWAEWRGGLSVGNATIHAIRGFGFEHGEENCWREGRTGIGFRSDTYGDTDAIEIDASDLAQATLKLEASIGGPGPASFEHCPSVSWEVSGAELLQSGRLRRELGGAGLFVALERLADAPMPREVSGEMVVDAVNGPHGHRPVYLVGRQIDDTKVWTSPLFMSF